MQHTVSAPTNTVKAVEPAPVTESSAQCAHCGYRGSHAAGMCSLIVDHVLVLTPMDRLPIQPCPCPSATPALYSPVFQNKKY